jgi:hypothetical protein
MGHDALDGLPFTSFIVRARGELMGSEMPGMIRYRGDQYHNNYSEQEGEAAWFMGLPYLASMFFRSAEKTAVKGQTLIARQFYAKGASYLEKAYDIVEDYGYPPELFEKRQDGWGIPGDGTSSHIGWNDAALIQAGSRALKLQNQLGIAEGL